VNAWIRECEIAWVDFTSVAEAESFEKRLHAEWLPLLNKR
jgi:hypothetical protein